MKFTVTLESVRIETWTFDLEADTLEAAEKQADDLRRTARACGGGWVEDADFVRVESVEPVKAPAPDGTTESGGTES